MPICPKIKITRKYYSNKTELLATTIPQKEETGKSGNFKESAKVTENLKYLKSQRLQIFSEVVEKKSEKWSEIHQFVSV